MSVHGGPADWWTEGTDAGRKHVATKGIVQNGLVLNLDAGVSDSYPGTGSTWSDLTGNGNNFTLDSSGITYNALGYFSLNNGGISRNGSITSSVSCTCVFWLKTLDTQSLFWSATTSGGFYLGAYRIGNKFYNDNAGNPTFFINTITKTNIYDNIINDQWCMIEFKSVNFNSWSTFNFSRYSNFSFDNSLISHILIYNKNLSDHESLQNFNATRGRYGI